MRLHSMLEGFEEMYGLQEEYNEQCIATHGFKDYLML